MNVKIRDARDDDSDGLIRLIGDCFSEYPGCVLDVEGEAPELISPATWHKEAGGRLWVAEGDGTIVGCVAILPEAERSAELKKLYVSSELRRLGLGARLCGLVEAEARRRGATTVMLWSDTRFEDAHRLYEGRGYERGPDTRELHDASKSVEYYFRRSL
ncbi:MAG: GNAT family N-acetyltransferase [Chloroflexi bacterium]|nr:GNAT family N-acetyltransferase [Chloroflexota bacterium]MCI0784215.1 GNAT family N-acetyltransferase [Chloroflexota bacterium]MCI0814582.1 GNAT family N-acetyltransferase [Chloroflexota bacterium]MCI0820073.1 GNAT family N-acetyltransferase [Chloroflexota bacterium]MCI0831475.1 GNAT family N-acetyltransferase [Chloroflexota bacterium]